jgi:hypothetical protein
MAATPILDCDTAKDLARERGMFARRSGKYLVFYAGNEHAPNTWLEAGRTLIKDNGINRSAFEAITEYRTAPALAKQPLYRQAG